MKYFKVYDMYSPQGQLYRVNEEGVLQVQDGEQWCQSAWQIFFGSNFMDHIQAYMSEYPDARLEEVECPAS